MVNAAINGSLGCSGDPEQRGTHLCDIDHRFPGVDGPTDRIHGRACTHGELNGIPHRVDHPSRRIFQSLDLLDRRRRHPLRIALVTRFGVPVALNSDGHSISLMSNFCLV